MARSPIRSRSSWCASNEEALATGPARIIHDKSLALTVGACLGVYEITALIGAGHRFLVNTVVDQPTRPALTVILNWQAALGARERR